MLQAIAGFDAYDSGSIDEPVADYSAGIESGARQLTVGVERDYYFALQHRRFAPYAVRRLLKNVVTRYHATHPWTIPGKLIGETRGMLLAMRLHRRGRRLH